MSRETDRRADSAGTPWAGRHFDANPSTDDDGSAPASLVEALRRFHSGEAGEAAVVDAIRSVRLLVPLVTHLGEAGEDEQGRRIDKTQELGIVTVVGPDSRTVLPVFSSVATMGAWNPRARPVPADGIRIALAAVQQSTDLIVLDATSETEFVVRRPAVWAIARQEPWQPSYCDLSVKAAFEESIASELAVLSVALAPGDPGARLAAAELVVRLELLSGLTQGELDAVLERLAARWAANETIATRVDSLAVQLVAAT